VREFESNDVEADIILGTVYQRLNRLTLSDEALDRAIKAKDINSEQRAEVHALRGRNAKTHWLEAWLEKPGPEQACWFCSSPSMNRTPVTTSLEI
jgi:hypothetical protein